MGTMLVSTTYNLNLSLMSKDDKPTLHTSDILEKYRDKILDVWYKELSTNSHFSKEKLFDLPDIKHHSYELLSDTFLTLKEHSHELFYPEGLDPVLELWRTLLTKHIKKGLGTRNMALLIFALKSSVLNLLSNDLDASTHNAFSLLDRLLNVLGMISFEFYTAEKETQILQQEGHIKYLQNTLFLGKLIGNSPKMQAVYDAIGLILENDITILLEGESGTGKDLIASTIHQNSNRNSKPFIAVNCGAIPKELIESELFGHEKGAFTGAESKKLGKFELANGGTLFLDEIAELPLDMQVKLLRVLQNKEVVRVGGSESIPLDIRIIAATNQSLKERVDSKHFRLDLFYRLNVYPIKVPPLRERENDILLISAHFLEKYSSHFNLSKKNLSQDAEQFLLNHSWEGNIRELENLIQRALIVSKGPIITRSALEFEPGEHLSHHLLDSPNTSASAILPLEYVEQHAIQSALQFTKGNIKKTATALGISRTTLYNKLKKYGIDETGKLL